MRPPFFSFSSLRKKRIAAPGEEKEREARGNLSNGSPSTPSVDQSLALYLRRMEVSVLTVSVGREMPAIIKIACGVVKFQMAKL